MLCGENLFVCSFWLSLLRRFFVFFTPPSLLGNMPAIEVPAAGGR